MDSQVKAVLESLPRNARERSTRWGVILFFLCVAEWVLGFAAILYAPFWLSLIASVSTGISTSMLFIVGHDACHGSLTSSHRLNRLLGTLAFLPSMHPFSSWRRNHNGMHHVWTNLKQEDPGYAPFSFEEYQKLSPVRRLMERCYRTTFGVGLFYFVELWWKLQIFPKGDARPVDRREFLIDRLSIVAFVSFELLLGYVVATQTGRSFPALYAVYAVVAPFCVFLWFMGFVTFQHHTHPLIPWFDDKEEWTFFQSQVAGTTHVQFPKFFEFFMLHIFDHAAHHVDPLIPLYHLEQSQQALENRYPQSIKIINWNLHVYWITLSCCKLYDYREHRWLDYQGNPTTVHQCDRNWRLNDKPKDAKSSSDLPTAIPL